MVASPICTTMGTTVTTTPVIITLINLEMLILDIVSIRWQRRGLLGLRYIPTTIMPRGHLALGVRLAQAELEAQAVLVDLVVELGRQHPEAQAYLVVAEV